MEIPKNKALYAHIHDDHIGEVSWYLYVNSCFSKCYHGPGQSRELLDEWTDLKLEYNYDGYNWFARDLSGNYRIQIRTFSKELYGKWAPFYQEMWRDAYELNRLFELDEPEVE